MELRLMGVDTSVLMNDGGLPGVEFREKPRVGGGAGSDCVDGEVSCAGWEEYRMDPGRRDGGGGGAFTLCTLCTLCELSERGLPVLIATVVVSSSTLGERRPESLRNFESDTS